MTFLAILTVLATPTAELSITVEGEGYLRFMREGRAVYARSATLAVRDGRIANQFGDAIAPTIMAKAGVTLEADANGDLFLVDGKRTRIGRLVLAVFESGNLTESEGVLIAADRPQLVYPGENGAGSIRTTPPLRLGQKGATGEAPQAPPLRSGEKGSGNEVPKTPHPRPGESGSGNEVPKSPPLRSGERGPGGEVSTPIIRTHSTAEVESDPVRLRDIAEIEGSPEWVKKLSDVEIGPLPVFGVKRRWDRTQLVTRLRMAGYDPKSIELEVRQPILVSRKGQSISHAQFVEAALTVVKNTSGVSVTYANEETQPDLSVPIGRLNLVVEALSGVNTPQITAIVGIFVEGKRLNSRTVRLKATTNPQAVRSGQPVRVLMRAGGATIEVAGIARSSGPVGGQIQVEVQLDPKNRSTHQGLIKAEGIVEVTV